MIKKLTLIFAILLNSIGFSQSSNLGNWMIYFGNFKINSKLNLHHEVQYRNYNSIGDLEQLLLRTGLGYNLSENNNNLLLGYGYILSENYNDLDEKNEVQEHRIYQQFQTKQKFGRFTLGHRYRFEERFIEDNFKFRFRYFLTTKMALNQKTITDKTIYLSAYNEIFLSGHGAKFDRNRLYGGLGYKLNENLSFELGYMNQFFESSSRDQINIIMSASF